MMLIDNAGTPNVTATYRYDPFGNTITTTGTNAANNVYRFSSKERHANSGMYYYGYRFYDPNLQRWLNRDPLGEKTDRNLYRFAMNNALSYLDPYGLDLISLPASPPYKLGPPIQFPSPPMPPGQNLPPPC